MNTAQRLTRTNKPIINSIGLPLFNKPVEMRIKNAKQLLGFNKPMDNDARWNNIVNHANSIMR